MKYDTYSDLVNALESGFLDINGKTNGNITGTNAEKMASFYKYWSNYLDSTPAFLSFLAYVPGAIAKALYSITASLEHVFNNMFKLFGLFGYLGNSHTVIGQFFYWFQVLGTTLFSLILVISAITGVFTKPVKYKGVITNFLLVTMVTAVLPLALTTVSSAIAQDAMNIQTVSSDAPKASEKYSSLAIQPMKNNIVDLKVLIDNDFSTELFPLDDYGYIKPPKEGSTPVNNITDSSDKRDTTDFATRIDFGATYGASNSGLLDTMEGQYNKKFGVKGIKGLFLHKLNANQDGVESITQHRIVGELNAFEPVYMRYKVNWIGMFMQYIILIVLLISMSIKLVKSVFDIVIEAMISPLQGYSSLSNSKKYKELLRTMGGALAGIFFEVVIMRVTLEICRDLPTLSVSAVTKLSGGFFDGLNMWEQCLAASLVYIGIFFAAMQGVTMIERWLGVSTGHSDTAQQLLGAMMMGNAFATGAGAIGNGAMAMGGFGIDMAKKAPGAVVAGSKVLGNSLATTGGGIRGAFNAVRDQGVVNAAKGGLSNMYSAGDLAGKEAIGKAKDFAGGIADSLGNKEQAGHDAVYRGLKDYSHPEEVKPVSPFDPDASAGFEPLSDAGPAGGGVTDPTLPSSEPSDGISEPLQSVTITDESGTNTMPLHEWVGDSEPPKGGYKMFETVPNSITNQPDVKQDLPTSYNHKVQSNFQKSMHQMNYVNQQMQQAGQRMQGQSHIKGAEIDESDE
ncbi:TPA: pLS20_p028 family conjugation system transmembrane protein [Streptococcus agalactiae]